MTSDCWELDLAYKGERNYLHGTDIAFELFRTVDVAHEISIQFHKVVEHPLVANYVSDSDLSSLRASSPLCVLMFYTTLGGKKKIIALSDDNSRHIYRRNPYNEEEVIENSSISNFEIRQQSNNKFNFFERIVALNKALLNEIFGMKNWLFVRLDINDCPEKVEHISILFIREVGGAIYKSDIVSSGVVLGCIYFSRKKNERWD